MKNPPKIQKAPLRSRKRASIRLSRYLATRVVNLWAGPDCTARPSWNLGPVMLNFISISILKRFFNENLNFINNSLITRTARFVKPGIYNPARYYETSVKPEKSVYRKTVKFEFFNFSTVISI